MAAFGGRWYVLAVPDCERGQGVADRLSVAGDRVIRHASGRPWLVLNYPADQIVVNESGRNRIAMVGFSSASQQLLQRSADRVRGVDQLDDLAHELAGNHLLLASIDGSLRAQGTATGVRRVFGATIDGCHVVADRADLLAELGGFAMDEATLAIRLLRQFPHPLGDQPVWQGVRPVAPDHYATVDPGGRSFRTARWWRRPEPVLSRAEGAIRLCAALDDAVRTRTQAGGVVYSDLSGGFDSTPQTYFAARGPARVLAGTAYNDDPGGGEDLIWARRALTSMLGVEHSTFSTDEMPRFYGGLLELDACLDDPSDAYRVAPRMVFMMRRAIRHGARAYLNGQGGDELLTGHPKFEHTLFRQRPLLAVRRLRAYQLMEELSFRETFGFLLDCRCYGQWLADTLAATTERDDFAKPKLVMAWDNTVVWPKWLTAAARDAVIERIQQCCDTVTPLGEDLASHAELRAIRHGAQSTRGTEQLGAELGLAFQAPISDDRVTEAVLAVRREERTHPKEFKPLMREAMRGRLPDVFLLRTRKTSGAAQSARGIKHHENDLLSLCDDSPLIELGIINIDALRRHAFPRDRWFPVRDLDTTLNCALFTRNQRRRRSVAPTAAIVG